MEKNDSILSPDALPILNSIPSLIMVAGVGGAGGNAVNHMHRMGINGVNMAVFNTDAQALAKSPVGRRILLGKDGLGAGNFAEDGARKAKESSDHIRETFRSLGTQMLFLAAGMGGGTGTGATPVIAEIAQEMGILTVAIVTVAEENEGDLRRQQAERGVSELARHVDALIVISNAAISKLYRKLSVRDAYDKANEIVAKAAKGIAEIITTKSDMVNVDFADVQRVIRRSGRAVMGVATATGDERALDALRECLRSPLLGETDIVGARNVLVNFAYSSQSPLTIEEKNRVLERIQSEVGMDDEDGRRTTANIIWGTSLKDGLGEMIELIVVVSGFPEKKEAVLGTEQAGKENEGADGGTDVAPVPQPGPVPPLRMPGEQSKAPARIPRGHDRYCDIAEMISQPAYLRFDVKLRTTVTSRKEAQKGSGEEDGPRSQDLFSAE